MCVRNKLRKKRKSYMRKKCSCVAKLLNSCGFVSCLILLQKLLSLFATWLEPISKYRNVSCNNLNELTINFIFFRFRVLFWIMFLLESSFVYYLACSNFCLRENITISLTICGLKSGNFDQINFYLFSFLRLNWFHFCYVQNFSRYVCMFFWI